MKLPLPTSTVSTATAIKEEQNADVVKLYQGIQHHTHKLQKAVFAYEKQTQKAIQYYTTLGISPDATNVIQDLDPKFNMLLEIIAQHNAYALNLQEFEKIFRAEWKKEKKKSLEQRARYLDAKGMEFAKMRIVFEEDARASMMAVGAKPLGEDDGEDG